MTAIGRHIQTTCHPQFQQAPEHQVLYLQPSVIQPPTPYSCPNQACIASNELHWALRKQQALALQQGKANLKYLPFSETKSMCGDADEACDLAVEAPGYPPTRVPGARVGPEWLSRRQWQKFFEMYSRDKNILEIAAAVGKNASLLRLYFDTYLKNGLDDNVIHNAAPLPSASSSRSSWSQSAESTAGSLSTESSDLIFPLGDEVMVPQEGAPEPSYLSRSEQEMVWVMFQQNASIRGITDKLHKTRHKISQYINAYMRPRLLKLQAEQREAENRIVATPTYITPVTETEGILETIICEPDPIAAAAKTPPVISREPSLHSIGDADLEMELIDPLPAATTEDPKTSDGTAPFATNRSAGTENSLFGDSPVDENHASSPLTQLFLTDPRQEPAQPTSRKRQHDYDGQAEPPRASKRPRHHSFP